ncbi:MAG: GDCCVxC domain-containing (seleno)protein [Candidatus Hodarchaeota archaeon]
MKTNSLFTCPECGQNELVEMPRGQCLISRRCNSCQEIIHPKNGDCCVFCSYGDTLCPPMQKESIS